MYESLLLFEEICNLKYFRKTPIIIFFNKKDIFQQKIKKVNLNVCFKEYKGGLSFKNALKFIQEKYIETDKSRGRQIYIHVTCATDTQNIRVVFDAVKNIILHDNLREYNLV